MKRSFVSVKNYNKEKTEMSFWELDEYREFIKAVDSIEFYNFFNLLFLTGIRRGEALALTWNDVDFKKKKIKISKSCSYIVGKGYVISKPKTESSIRSVMINEKFADDLKLYKEKCRNEFINFDYNSYIFSYNNEIFSKGRIDIVFNECIKKTRVTKIRINDLRYSHVALLIYMKEDVLTIKKRLGQTDVGITLNVYGHLYDSKDKELANKLDSII